MEAIITWKKELKNYLHFALKLENGESGKTYIVKGFRNEPNWSHLKIGDKVGGLVWHSETKKVISADSPVYRLG